MKNKKGQVGETMTWIIATIAIIIILILSILITNFAFGGGKSFKFIRFGDSIATKSLSAYLLTPDDSGKNVFNQLQDEENLNDFNGNLALKIFEGFYKKDYSYVIWFGVNFEGIGLRKNKYFGSYAKTSKRKGGDISTGYYSSLEEKVKFKKDKWMELVLMNK